MSEIESWRNVGRRIRQVRKSNRLTMKQLARGCGLSANTISLVERGEVAPSVETLCKISHALGVSAGSLFLEACTPQVNFQRASQDKQGLSISDEAISALSCGLPGNKPGHPVLPEYLERDKLGGICDVGRQLVLCLCGSLSLEVDDQTYCLEPGDTLTFNSGIYHRWKNPGELAGVSILVLYPENTID
jgi:transcriptional regulator with XRE-family HTH domain